MMIMRHGGQGSMFFPVLLLGVILSGTSKFIDWVQNMLTATGSSVFFSYNLDILTEVLQLLGIGIIFFSIFNRFFRSGSGNTQQTSV